ncbi:hypothetical protein L5515_013302 [Caenorhabditis briggsae]|uniref:F-box domain-containing protein n=1 Tax=Caenorhabditis briggsae TaxID=6238 RepID=A0AAE9E8T5_CAEBR|nr:hypothetical protein L5515_013302 [Caenorhabditis briggsae]
MILRNLDFVSIQCLRKTSRDLRNFIDDVKPESKVTEFQLEFGDSCIKFLPKFDDKKDMLIRYQKAPNGGLGSLIHFNLIKMDLFEVSLEMILSLKEAFLRSPHMMNYEISFRKSDAEEHLVELFGEDFELESFWYFGIPDDLENVISFGFGSNFIVFERILRNIVPIGARIL